ncbi:MAG: hypothetical protein ACI4NE_00945 [Succinivibrio sp.]
MQKKNQHWAQAKELKGAAFGVKALFFIYSLLGRRVFSFALFFVVLFYYAISPDKRYASREFLTLVNRRREELGLKKLRLRTFVHFMSFGDMLLDKITAFQGKIIPSKDIFYVDNSNKRFEEHLTSGKIYFVSHLGNAEALKGISFGVDITVNSIVFVENADKFNSFYNAVAKDSKLNLIATQNIGPDTAILLKSKIDNGEIVTIAADRTAVSKERTRDLRQVEVSFLNKKVMLPQGPFILASLLKCPVQIIFALKNPVTHKLDLVCEDIFKGPVILSRKTRDDDIKKYAQMYASCLEKYALEYPYQWFNFYNYFSYRNFVNLNT